MLTISSGAGQVGFTFEVNTREKWTRNSFSCARMLNWVLKLFHFHVIMSKVRIANSGGSYIPSALFLPTVMA
jgi:hypothetical protein